MSKDRPPKLGKSGNNGLGKRSSRRFKKTETKIREKLDSLELKKKGTNITSKVSSLKSRTKGKKKKDGPAKLGKSDTQTPESRSNILKRNINQIIRKNPKLLIFSLIIIITLVVAASIWSADKETGQNQTDNTTNQTTQKNHYSDGIISFDYPYGWNVTCSTEQQKSKTELLVTVSKDQNNSVSIFREELGNQNFTNKVAMWRSNIAKNGMIYYEGGSAVDNITAYEIMANYKPGNKVYAIRGIALQKNKVLYFIIFIFDDPLLNYNDEMKKILHSFKVTENPNIY